MKEVDRSWDMDSEDVYSVNGKKFVARGDVVTADDDIAEAIEASKVIYATRPVPDEVVPAGETYVINVTEHLTDDSIPAYYETEYALTKETVESHYSNDSFNAILASDLHFAPQGSGYNENKLRTPLFTTFKAIRKMAKEIPTALLGFLGDYMQVPEVFTKAMGVSNLAELNSEFDNVGCPTMAIAGNHEVHYRGNAQDVGLTDDECYQFLMKKWEGRNGITKVSKHTFYLLDDANHVCYVFVSSFNHSQTYSYVSADFASVVSANVNNYPYIIFNHFAYDKDQTPKVCTGVKNSIDYIKTTLGKTIIAWIGGHVHMDSCVVWNNTLVLTINNSGFYSSSTKYPKTIGTETESAFTVMTVVPTTGKLYMTRFGAGIDHEYNYNTTSGAIGEVTGETSNYAVIQNLSNGVSSDFIDAEVEGGDSLEITLSVPDVNFTITDVSVLMGGNDVTASAYDSISKTISIDNVTGVVEITASATNPYMWTVAESTLSPYSSTSTSEYSVQQNNLVLEPSAGNKGFLARMDLKEPFTRIRYGSFKCDSISYTGGEGILINCGVAFYDENNTKLKGIGFFSEITDYQDAVTGIARTFKDTELGNATYIVVEIRTKSNIDASNFPMTLTMENARIEFSN